MDAQKIDELKKRISGIVAVASDEVYKKASKMFTRTIVPSVVVRPASSKDVAATVRFVREYNVPFAIRSGGHNSIANRLKDGILLIDMSGFANIEVLDKEKGVVRVGAGALWHEVASELEKYDLGISSGDTRTVGVGGLSTGAGIGWMVRKYGPVVDNTISIEIVTADGQVLQASKDKNPDLFWAVRGGGSNFGIVTNFTFAAHPVKGIHIGMILYPLKNVGEVIKGWRDAMRQAPAELTTMLTTLPSFGGEPPLIMIRGCFDGTDKVAAETAFAPFLNLGEPTDQSITAAPYKDMLEDAMLPSHVRVVGSTTFLKEFTDEAIATIDTLCQDTAPILQIRHVGGVMNAMPVDESAFAFRSSEVLIVNPAFVSPDASEEDIFNATAAWRAIKPFGQGPYLNLLTQDTGEEVAEAYPGPFMERLAKIKAHYDPDNIFNSNYNIKPAK